MSDRQQPEPAGQSGGLYFAVGALMVAVLVIGYFALGGDFPGGARNVNVDVTVPSGETPQSENQPQSESTPQGETTKQE